MKKIVLFVVFLGSLFGISLYAYEIYKIDDTSAVSTAKKYIDAWNNQDLEKLNKLGSHVYTIRRFKRVYQRCLLEEDDMQLHIDNLTKIRKEFEPDFEYKIGYDHSIINGNEHAIHKEIYDFIENKKYEKSDFKFNEIRTKYTNDHDLKQTKQAIDTGDFIVKSLLGDNYKTKLTPYEYKMVCFFLGFRYINSNPVNKSSNYFNEILRHNHYSKDPKYISLRKSCLNKAIKTKDIDHINFIEEKKPAPDKSIVRLELILKDNTSYKISMELSLVDGKWYFVSADKWLPSNN